MAKDEDYNAFLQKSLSLKRVREERTKEIHKENLFKSAKKKIQTTMIGALSTLEEGFGFLWGFNDDSSEDLSSEQQHLKEIYDDVRAKILDRGNTQIRNLEAEFSHYEVTKKRYQINIPVVGTDTLKGEEDNDG
tara:strand:+ start:11174 stop:11575 length:402 start_codon:yes stop_codon:yes gene_type:complete